MDVKPPTNPNAADEPEVSASAAPARSVPISVDTPSTTDTTEPVSAVAPEPAIAENEPAPSAATSFTASAEAPTPALAPEPSVTPTTPASAAPVSATPASTPAATATTEQAAPVIVVGGGQQSPLETPVAPAATPGAMPPVGGSKGKKRWVLPVVVVAALALLGGGAYAYLVYLPNRPSAVYSTSMTNTGKAVDVLVDYTQDQAKKDYKGAEYTVALKGDLEGSSMNMDISGTTDDTGNSTATVSADVLGQKFSAETRTIGVKGSAMPDMYFKVSGVKKVLDSFGMQGSAIEGQWISVDHTVTNSYLQTLQENSADLSNLSADVGVGFNKPTTEQLQDAFAKMQQVNKQYLFTDDADKAVVTNKKFVAKETQDGRSVYHYTVGYDKNHLAAYVTEVGKALDGSKLNAWVKAMGDKQDISKAMDFDSLKKSVQDAKGDYTFDMWVDAKTKLVSALKFVDPEDKDLSLTISQGYTGTGTAYPFTIKSEDRAKGAGTMELGLTIDTSSNKVSGTVKLDTSSTKITGTMSATPTNKLANVIAPTGAKTFDSILKSFGLNQDSLLPSADLYGASSGADLFGSSL